MKRGLSAAICSWAWSARAHGFGERYDLPLPLSWWVTGAVLTVFLTFLGSLWLLRKAPSFSSSSRLRPFKALASSDEQAPRWAGALGVFFLALALVSALWGTSDPLMNLAPTLIWIVAWQGMSFVVVLLGNVWPALDPFRQLHHWLKPPPSFRTWAPALGVWPATTLLLLWSALEVIYPLATTPFKVGCALLCWMMVSLWGQHLWGKAWHANADFVSLYLAWMGRLSLLGRPAPTEPDSAKPGQLGFVMAMLSTVLFDGLHGGSGWLVFEAFMRRGLTTAIDPNGYAIGACGLLGVWLVQCAGYGLVCHITAWTSGTGNMRSWAVPWLPTLVPIAVAYNVAHNFSSMVIQGQSFVQLLSDPLGRQWNVLGTATWYPDIGLLDAEVNWYIALTSIVVGHMVSVVMAHRVAMGLAPRRVFQATWPLTLWMLSLTALSLYILADPMTNGV